VATLHLLSHPIDDAQRGELLFRGDLVVFEQVPALSELCILTDRLAGEALAPFEGASYVPSGGNQYDDALDGLRERFRKAADAKALFRAALEHVGVDVERTCWDWLHLRIQLPERAATRDRGTLGFHRDTWASNVYAQTNWWTPISPLTSERTIAFYPAYWSRPLANTSADWDLEVIRARRRSARLGQERVDVPLVPEPCGAVDTSSELRMVIQPGDLLCFSGAHLHASVPNTSDRARVSVEVRTVNLDDLARSREAPNIDGRAPRVALGWFRRIPDGQPLADLGKATAHASSGSAESPR
jgi:hypothetical protein